jgi:hypothetical protein
MAHPLPSSRALKRSLARNSCKAAAEEIVTDFDGALRILKNCRMNLFSAPAGCPLKSFRPAPMIGCRLATPHRFPFHAAVDPDAVDRRIFENVRSGRSVCRLLIPGAGCCRFARLCCLFLARNRFVGLSDDAARRTCLGECCRAHRNRREHSECEIKTMRRHTLFPPAILPLRFGEYSLRNLLQSVKGLFARRIPKFALNFGIQALGRPRPLLLGGLQQGDLRNQLLSLRLRAEQ